MPFAFGTFLIDFSSTTVETNGSARLDSNGAERSISYQLVGATRDFQLTKANNIALAPAENFLVFAF